MTDSTPATLTILPTPDAAVCDGDVCVIPGLDDAAFPPAAEHPGHSENSENTDHPEHAIVARRLDDDLV